jgi:hypothetical protein
VRPIDQTMVSFLGLIREQSFSKHDGGLATFSGMGFFSLFQSASPNDGNLSQNIDLEANNKLLDAESKTGPKFEGLFLTDLGVEFLRRPDAFVLNNGRKTRRKIIDVDTSAWTGLKAVRIHAANATIVSSLIEAAIDQLSTSQEGSEATVQAAAYLRAANELVNAPDPPSIVIWDLVQEAAAVAGLLQLFSVIFQQVIHAQTH